MPDMADRCRAALKPNGAHGFDFTPGDLLVACSSNNRQSSKGSASIVCLSRSRGSAAPMSFLWERRLLGSSCVRLISRHVKIGHADLNHSSLPMVF
jgi:hypothetical protein